MKLSEAMMLGGTTNKLDWMSWDCCLLGVSCKALGAERNCFNDEACRRWPWIWRFDVQAPSFSKLTGVHSFVDLVSNLAVAVQRGTVTLEQVVDWVASIEPQEEAADSGLGTHCDSVEAELSRK